jgi:hypothetical protein
MGFPSFFKKAGVRSNRAPCNDRISGSPKPEYRYAILPVITHYLSSSLVNLPITPMYNT